MILKSGTEPTIDVGLMLAEKVELLLNGEYVSESKHFKGELNVLASATEILFNQAKTKQSQIYLYPQNSATFTLKNMPYGIDFHWERTEDLVFTGELILQLIDGKIQVINRVPLEDYLQSVIASEMSASASHSLLMAHAVMSRSWLLSQLVQSEKKQHSFINEPQRIIRWYDREDHDHFDVCADDHCQRYQGITRIANKNAKNAVEQTRGKVLMSTETVCDARFSKCCGGISEAFQFCWEDEPKAYLVPINDDKANGAAQRRSETEWQNFILGSPDAFCNNTD